MANGCNIWASATTNSITVNAQATYTGSTWNGYGVSCSISVDGVGSWNGSIVLPQGGSPRGFSHTFSVNEDGLKDRTFTCRASWDSSWSAAGGNSSNSCTVRVPKRAYTAHGTPNFSTNISAVLQGESITLSWSKAATQGNANFDHFELAMGGKALYSGTNTSYSIKPSDWTGANGGDLSFTLKEVHEWYGTYPSTSKTLTVHVIKNHGNPTVSANRNGYYQGESATISWTKAANQGNSTLDRFELWRGGTRVYSGKNTSYTETPSSVTGANGGSITYTLKEVHTFYGRTLTTQATKSISVIKNFGTPRLTASKTTCNYSESITLNFGKAAEQGNSAFNKFELYQGSTRLYSGSGTSYLVTPSDYTGARGGNVIFKLKEIHEWHGRYPEKETTLTINVRSGVVSAYDSSGNKHTGLVTVYDGQGKLHFVLITAYDDSGKAHSVV